MRFFALQHLKVIEKNKIMAEIIKIKTNITNVFFEKSFQLIIIKSNSENIKEFNTINNISMASVDNFSQFSTISFGSISLLLLLILIINYL